MALDVAPGEPIAPEFRTAVVRFMVTHGLTSHETAHLFSIDQRIVKQWKSKPDADDRLAHVRLLLYVLVYCHHLRRVRNKR